MQFALDLDMPAAPRPLMARERRDKGIKRALTHANAESGGEWGDLAYAALIAFLGASRGHFMAEDIRAHAHKHGLPQPPHLRAWGGIVTRAARAGLIRRIGFAPVKNERAHCANAAVWCRV